MVRYLLQNFEVETCQLLEILDDALRESLETWRVFKLFFKNCPQLKNQRLFKTIIGDKIINSTLFHVAIEVNEVETLDFLIRNTTSESWLLKDENGSSILRSCLPWKKTESSLRVLKKYGYTRFCLKEEIPLYDTNDASIQRELLLFNPDFDKDDSASGNTTLHVAARTVSDDSFLEILFSKHSTKLMKANKTGETPFYVALSYNNEAAVSILQRVLEFDDLYKAFTTTPVAMPGWMKEVLDEKLRILRNFIFELNLSSVLTNDVCFIIYDYLGLPKKTNKRKSFRTPNFW